MYNQIFVKYIFYILHAHYLSDYQVTEDCSLRKVTEYVAFQNGNGEQCNTTIPVDLGVCRGKCTGEQVR